MHPNFPIWKTITLGDIKTVDEIKSEILSKGFRIGSWAEDVLSSKAFSIASSVHQINIYKVTPRDLGFQDGAFRKDVYNRAIELLTFPT